MKKLFLILVFLMPFMGLWAQITHTSNGNVDANAEKVLAKASNKMNSGCVSFLVAMVSKDANKKESSKVTSQVLYNKGKYRVTFGDQVLYCNGQSVWNWNKKAKEVVVDKVSASDDDLMNPAQLLSNYKKNYKAKFIRTEPDGTSVVDLTPKKSKSFYKVRLLIASSGTITSMLMHNYDGSSMEFAVSNFKTGVKYSDSDFTFSTTDHKEVEVIDMR